MVSMLFAGVGKSHTLSNGAANLLFDFVDFFSHGQDVIFVSPGNGDNTVGIATQDVTRENSRVADIDGTIHRFDLDPVFSGAHRITTAENRINDFTRQVRIAACALD